MSTLSRRSLLALGASGMVLPVAACSSAQDDARHVALVSKGFQHQFWQAVRRGAQAEADAQGAILTFEGPPAETDIEAQITMLQNAVTRNPDALGLAALDSRAAALALDEAASKGIPVVAFDSGVDSDIPLATVATDNRAAATKAAQHMCELIEGKGKVGIVAHDQVSLSGTDRRDGFLEGLEEYGPDVEVLEVQYGGGDQAASADIARSMVAAHDDLRGLFGTNEGSAIGVLKGVEEAGRIDLAIIGFDSGRAQVEAIRSGEMAGAVTQDPAKIGALTVRTALQALSGKKPEKVIDTGFLWYDASNLDSAEVQKAVYL
ncbi:BMP family ABC transporter substrate-binding protein [Brachybacterium endophyticum]|uniref:BMP family ABC transporter substrate-binding protein n=1 Tax=Brachybacterium endophyticum TaxID=2182385 RepID=A0A2U2RLL9_9MICO|nr:ABC transporter substrate-binding protein [Brachybacterium endophyticum]PWH06736.1 BMP family ABC transporter substrate-binding protein [Brachybacterium endophyticum]